MIHERIIAAANRHGGKIYVLPPPARHHNIGKMIHDRTGQPFSGDKYQGFFTSRWRYVSREEAARIAVKAGQTDAPKWGNRLYSEDLW